MTDRQTNRSTSKTDGHEGSKGITEFIAIRIKSRGHSDEGCVAGDKERIDQGFF